MVHPYNPIIQQQSGLFQIRIITLQMVVCIHKQSMIIHHSDHPLQIGMIRVMVVAHL